MKVPNHIIVAAAVTAAALHNVTVIIVTARAAAVDAVALHAVTVIIMTARAMAVNAVAPSDVNEAILEAGAAPDLKNSASHATRTRLAQTSQRPRSPALTPIVRAGVRGRPGAHRQCALRHTSTIAVAAAQTNQCIAQ